MHNSRERHALGVRDSELTSWIPLEGAIVVNRLIVGTGRGVWSHGKIERKKARMRQVFVFVWKVAEMMMVNYACDPLRWCQSLLNAARAECAVLSFVW